MTNTARTIHETGTRTGTAASIRKNLGVWSAKWRWVAPCDLYDRALDELLRDQREGQRDKLLAEIGQSAEALRVVAMIRLLGSPEARVAPLASDSLGAADVVRFLQLGANLGLRALGEPTDYVRGAFLVSPATVTKMVAIVTDVALRFLPQDLHEPFLQAALNATSRASDAEVGAGSRCGLGVVLEGQGRSCRYQD